LAFDVSNKKIGIEDLKTTIEKDLGGLADVCSLFHVGDEER
jgi:hypothetical protein